MTAGDVQWMTAGSGILHQEMPKGDTQGRMHGFQLWANLPSSLKMTDAAVSGHPSRGHSRRSRTTTAPTCGSSAASSGERRGPVEGVAADPIYLDISVPPGRGSGLRSRRRATRSPMCSRALARSATPRIPARF